MAQRGKGGSVGPQAPLMDAAVSRTASGVTVVTARVPQARSVSVGLWVRAGSRSEPAALNGISHFVEHLLFKGTRRRTARQISIAIEGRGGHLDAFTSEEHTCFYARATHEELPRVLDVLSDMLLASRFSAADIEKERDVIMEEIVMYRDQPQQLVQDILMESLWPRHALGLPIVGTPESVGRIRRADILAYVREQYRAGRLVLAFAGALEPADCVRLTERYFARVLTGGTVSPWRGGRRASPGEPVTVVARDTEQGQLALGFRLFGYGDPRRHALKILNAILGDNMSSRLFQAVRERYGLAYSIHSAPTLFNECGFLGIYAGMETGRMLRTLEVILRELRRLRSQPVPALELRRAKDYMIGQLRLSLEGTTPQMMWLGENFMVTRRFISPEQVIASMEAVTAEEVRALAGACLRPEALRLAAVVPEASAALETALRRSSAGL